ncbi:hypothetical protein Tco_0741076 [Tanacetum coccineum]
MPTHPLWCWCYYTDTAPSLVGRRFVASVGGDGEGGGLVAVMRMKVMGCSWMGSGGVLEGGQTVGSELGGSKPHRKKREEKEYEMEASDI